MVKAAGAVNLAHQVVPHSPFRGNYFVS